MKKQTAFTLIELLVVIAIIGLLAGAVSVAFSEARKNARDSRRITDLKAMRSAIEMYFDSNNSYPVCPGVYIDGATDCLSVALINGNFMQKVPTDPKFAGGAWGNDYNYSGGATNFNLRGRFEGQPMDQTHDYPNGTTCDSGVYPTASWNADAVYKGYGDGCALTLQYGTSF